jgi:hypothetical protein
MSARTAGRNAPTARAEIQMMPAATGKQQEIAIGIALQTHVLKICPVHHQLYCDDESCADDGNMARAFAVAVELVHEHLPFAEEFHHDAHELTDLLSDTIGDAPMCCPDCASPQ